MRISHKHVHTGILFAAIIIVLLLIVTAVFGRKSSVTDSSLKSYSDHVISSCSNEKNRQACYDREIPKLMDQGLSMEQSFDVIKLIQNEDPGYWFCHAVAHKLSANEYYRDPSQWANVMNRCPVGMCSNGCLHGALQAHFSAESLNGVQIDQLLPDLQGICEKRANWNPTPQEQSSCYHELGHLSMYLAGSDINEAAHICDTVGVRPDGRNYLQTCHEGIFMQVFEPREPDDFSLIYNLVPDKEKLSVCDNYAVGVEKGACWKIGWRAKYADFCNLFGGDIRYACFREAWVVNDDKIQTSKGIVEYCSYADNDPVEKQKCYNKVFYGLMASWNFDTERMKPLCSSFSSKDIEGQCFANTASRLIETDSSLVNQAVGICAYAQTLGVSDPCYRELISYANFVFFPGSDDSVKLCKAMPTAWSQKCFPQSKK